MKILIISLFSGENEYEESLESLRKQEYKNWDLVQFENLPNVEAHQAVYTKIMAASQDYDLFIKLDADFVFHRSTVLSEIVELFSKDKQLDYAVLALTDWYSGGAIMGMCVFSNRVKWTSFKEDLFVDERPSMPGYQKVFWDAPAPVAMHSPDPSLREAFLFGYHRALKIIQRNKRVKCVQRAKNQFELLQKVWHHYQDNQDMRRLIALYGAESAFSSKEKVLKEKYSPVYDQYVERFLTLPEQELHRDFQRKWSARSLYCRYRYGRYLFLPSIIEKTVTFLNPAIVMFKKFLQSTCIRASKA